MIEDFFYYWNNYDLKTAWWVLRYSDDWIEKSNDLEVWLTENESTVATAFKAILEKEIDQALHMDKILKAKKIGGYGERTYKIG